jgi:hypothetical protein
MCRLRNLLTSIITETRLDFNRGISTTRMDAIQPIQSAKPTIDDVNASWDIFTYPM